jgi:uncharacterized membrane protein (DUF485 family)
MEVFMGHGPTTKWGDDKSIPFKIKLGLWMFFFYLLLYGGFIVINVVNPKLMSIDIGSLNLAIVYGFSLIIIALIMALIYNFLSAGFEKKYNKKDPKEGSK